MSGASGGDTPSDAHATPDLVSWLSIAGEVLVAATLLLAVAAKLRSASPVDDLAHSLKAFRGVPSVNRRFLAVSTILFEALLGMGVLVPSVRIVSLLGAVMLFAVFAAVISATLASGSAPRCACFGATTRPVGRAHVITNLLLASVALAVATAPAPRPTDPGGYVAVATATVLLAVAIARVDVIVPHIQRGVALR